MLKKILFVLVALIITAVCALAILYFGGLVYDEGDLCESETYELSISDNFVEVAKSWNISNPTVEKIELDQCSSIKRINAQDFLVKLGDC